MFAQLCLFLELRWSAMRLASPGAQLPLNLAYKMGQMWTQYPVLKKAKPSCCLKHSHVPTKLAELPLPTLQNLHGLSFNGVSYWDLRRLFKQYYCDKQWLIQILWLQYVVLWIKKSWKGRSYRINALCQLLRIQQITNWGEFLWYKHEAELFPPKNIFLLISSSADLMRPMYIMEGKQGNLLLQSNGLQIWITFIKVL